MSCGRQWDGRTILLIQEWNHCSLGQMNQIAQPPETLLSDKQVGSGRIIAFGHFERGLQNLDQIGPLGNDLRREAVLFAIGGTQPPVANFTANVTSGTAPLTVQFTDTSTGVITGTCLGNSGIPELQPSRIHPTIHHSGYLYCQPDGHRSWRIQYRNTDRLHHSRTSSSNRRVLRNTNLRFWQRSHGYLH